MNVILVVLLAFSTYVFGYALFAFARWLLRKLPCR